MATFQLFFQSTEQVVVHGIGGSPKRSDPENRVGDQDIGSVSRPVSSGMQASVNRGTVVQEQDPLCELSAAFFLQNILQSHQQR